MGKGRGSVLSVQGSSLQKVLKESILHPPWRREEKKKTQAYRRGRTVCSKVPIYFINEWSEKRNPFKPFTGILHLPPSPMDHAANGPHTHHACAGQMSPETIDQIVHLLPASRSSAPVGLFHCSTLSAVCDPVHHSTHRPLPTPLPALYGGVAGYGWCAMGMHWQNWKNNVAIFHFCMSPNT